MLESLQQDDYTTMMESSDGLADNCASRKTDTVRWCTSMANKLEAVTHLI